MKGGADAAMRVQCALRSCVCASGIVPGVQWCLGLLAILDAAFQFGIHPPYSSVYETTLAGSMAQVSAPGQGSYRWSCAIPSSENNNIKPIKIVT